MRQLGCGATVVLGILIILSMCQGCYNDFGQEFQQYWIKKGHHQAHLVNQGALEQHTISRDGDRLLVFQAVFGEGTTYDNVAPQINKLYGLSVGPRHLKYSARIGWMWDGAEIEIFAYWIHDGEKNWKKLGAVQPHTYNEYVVRIDNWGYHFEFNDVSYDVEATVPSKDSYRLYPYFGGNTPAPHDMSFIIVENGWQIEKYNYE